MKLSDKLKAARADLFDRLKAISDNAADRVLNDSEAKEFDTLKASLEKADAEIVREVAREEATRSGAPAPMVIRDDKGIEHTLLRSTDKLIDRPAHKAFNGSALRDEASFGAAIRGLATGKWDGRVGLQRALGESTLPGGGYAVPAPLAAMWLDLMRARSVMVAAGTMTLPMDSLTLRVAGIASDPVPTSRKENTAVALSDGTFRAVDFKAKSYGVIVTSSLELLADSPNAEAMIEASLLGAMALAMDAGALNGDGLTTGNLDNVLGLLNIVGLPSVPDAVESDYDVFLDAIGTVRTANHTPNASITSPAVTTALGKLKTGLAGDKTTLVPPAAYTALNRLDTTSMPAATAVLGDFTKGAIGLREGLQIEASREGSGAFGNAQVVIRALLRFDYHALYVPAFCRMTAVAPASASAPHAAARR